MSEVDDAIASARASWERITADAAGASPPGAPRRRRQAAGAARRRLTNIAIVDAGIVFLAFLVGLAHPLGIMGALAVLLLLLAATVALALWPTERAPAPEQLRSVDLKALPRQTERWLEAQRPALPAPAARLADQIGVRLDQLAPQLAALDERAPQAEELRKLVAEQLPEFVRGYQRVPVNLRATPRNGTTPDAQLVDGLKVIDRQIGELSEQLAQGDLDALSTRGRYLEMKYQGDDTAA